MSRQRGELVILRQIWDFWTANTGRTPADGDPVFSTKDGKRLGSSKRFLTELFRQCDLAKDYRGMARTLYSFCHFYISQQLAHGVDVFHLARNTGTSLAMIDKVHGQVTNERMREHLRLTWE